MSAIRKNNVSLVTEDLSELNLSIVAKLWLNSFEYHKPLDPQYYRDCNSTLLSDIRGRLRQFLTEPSSLRQIKVAVYGEKVTGFIIYSIQTTFDFDQNSEPYGSIQELYVSSDFRSRGVGSFLMKTAREWIHSKGIDTIRIQAAFDNEQAIKFYQSQGFQIRQAILSN